MDRENLTQVYIMLDNKILNLLTHFVSKHIHHFKLDPDTIPSSYCKPSNAYQNHMVQITMHQMKREPGRSDIDSVAQTTVVQLVNRTPRDVKSLIF